MDLRKNSSIALGLLILAGCGIYSFRGNLPPHIKSIAVATVANQTSEFAATDVATETVTNLFVKENILRVTDEDRADSNLQITITRVTDRPSTYTVGETVEEWRLDVTAQVVWYDITRNRPLFEKPFTGLGYYPPTGDISSDNVDNDGDTQIDEEDEFGDPREFALKVAIEKISADILNEVVSTW
ncbi:LPS assembly lipoprotein LptE [Candidatus Neomarinimicrobiota bacterium]